MQFHQPSRAPLDEVGPDLSDNVVTLMESLWRNPTSKDQASQIYGSLPRPANLPCLHKTRINEEIANKLPRHVTDKDSVLGSVQWGLQFAARPLAHLLEAIDRGETPELQTLAEVTVTSLKLLARSSVMLNNIRRDNVKRCLQPSIQSVAANNGSQGFAFLLGDNLPRQLSAINELNKTALDTLAVNRPRNQQRRGRGSRTLQPDYRPPYGSHQGNARRGPIRGRPRHRTRQNNRNNRGAWRPRGQKRGQDSSRNHQMIGL